MTRLTKSTLSNEQTTVWLRGLLTVAWADGQFDAQEQNLITELTQTEVAPEISGDALEPIAPAGLAAVLGQNSEITENFLRTAVMVAIADGVYSTAEDELLHQFCQVLGQDTEVLQALRLTLVDHESQAPTEQASELVSASDSQHTQSQSFQLRHSPLQPLQEWLDQLDIHDPQVARFLCKMIPAQCPFERDIELFGRKVVHIPPLCKLNPLYEQLVGLRFRSLSYLADECGEDVSPYC